jgi:hypothetical protein
MCFSATMAAVTHVTPASCESACIQLCSTHILKSSDQEAMMLLEHLFSAFVYSLQHRRTETGHQGQQPQTGMHLQPALTTLVASCVDSLTVVKEKARGGAGAAGCLFYLVFVICNCLRCADTQIMCRLLLHWILCSTDNLDFIKEKPLGPSAGCCQLRPLLAALFCLVFQLYATVGAADSHTTSATMSCTLCSTDNLDFIKEKAIKAISRLLSAKPEGEQALLAALFCFVFQLYAVVCAADTYTTSAPLFHVLSAAPTTWTSSKRRPSRPSAGCCQPSQRGSRHC